MFDLLLNHKDFLIVNKHEGVSVHKDNEEVPFTQVVASALGEKKLYLVHRLDKMTSGILILAKHSDSASELSALFRQRQINKYYLAIGDKKPTKKQGLIVGDMVRSRRASWKLTPTVVNPAVTQFFSLAGAPSQRIFLLKPHTGKTHQIRVALKSIGSAIVGDPIYNPSSIEKRGYLHAFAVRFVYHGEPIELLCDPLEGAIAASLWRTEPMQAALEQWRQPWALKWPTLAHHLISR